MLDAVFAPQIGLKDSSRLPSISRSTSITAAELACLIVCGAIAALAVGLLHLQIRVPGHAILRGAFPMAPGIALVPRRGAGLIMAIAAGITATAMSAVACRYLSGNLHAECARPWSHSRSGAPRPIQRLEALPAFRCRRCDCEPTRLWPETRRLTPWH